MCDAKGDMISALILKTFECIIKFNGFTAEVHSFIFLSICSHGMYMNFGGSQFVSGLGSNSDSDMDA